MSPWKAPRRNRQGAQFESLKRGRVQKWETMHDALTSAYYDDWQHGRSNPVAIGGRTFDQLTKAQFNRVKGDVDYYLQLTLIVANRNRLPANRVDIDKLNPRSDPEDPTSERIGAIMRRRLRRRAAQGKDFPDEPIP